MEWDYLIEDDVETLHTDGPLHDAIVVLVNKLSNFRLKMRYVIMRHIQLLAMLDI